MSHTPGPWAYEDGIVGSADDHMIADILSDNQAAGAVKLLTYSFSVAPVAP